MSNPEYYIVTGRTLDAEGTHIVSFQLHPVSSNVAGDPFNATWTTVAKSILDGVKFISATWSIKAERWIPGARLEVIVKTEQDSTTLDNLLNLPAVA